MKGASIMNEKTETNDLVLREQLVKLLRGGNAHMPLENAVADFPPESINTRPSDVPYTPWHLLEHIRIAQRDILNFIRDPDYKWLAWPEEYWPAQNQMADISAWNDTIRAIQSDTGRLVSLVEDPTTDLCAPLTHAAGYNILREILLVADHNAYHIGEFAILRQVMGAWPADHTT
jgi:DinB superfamily